MKTPEVIPFSCSVGTLFELTDEENQALIELARKEGKNNQRNGVDLYESVNLLADESYYKTIKPLVLAWGELINACRDPRIEPNYYSAWSFTEVWCSATYGKTGYYRPHDHQSPGSFWSGVYYPLFTEGAGHFWCQNLTGVWGGAHRWVTLPAQQNAALIFPSTLTHYTDPNSLDTAERICYAFNTIKNPPE